MIKLELTVPEAEELLYLIDARIEELLALEDYLPPTYLEDLESAWTKIDAELCKHE